MIPLSPALLVATAGAFLDVARTPNDIARLAEQFVASVDDPRATRWDAAFIHHAGYWSHFDHGAGRSSWPLPPTSDCEALAEFALAHNLLSAEAPEGGDVFLLWSPAKNRFVHAGIVLAAVRVDLDRGESARYECHTIEGNVTSTGCVGGERIARVRRILSPGLGDRTIRWTAREARMALVRPHAA